MKHLRQSLALALTLAVVGVFGLAFAQTTAGTDITNVASATFTDAGGTTRSADSNSVTTTVQTVYSLSADPSTVAPSGTNATVTDPATSDFTTTPFQTTAAAEGSTVEFDYTVTNGTNADSNISFTILQDVGDQFDFSSFTIIETDGAGNTIGTVTGPLLFTQGQQRFFTVQAVMPTGLTAGDTGKIDFVAINDDAVAAGADAPGVSFDNNNTAQVTVALYNLGLAKNATIAGPDTSGNYAVTLDFYIDATKAAGDPDIEITNLTLTDDLSAVFGTVPFSITAGPTIITNPDSAPINVNGAFNGGTDINLIDPATSSINTADGIVQIQIVVQVNGPVSTTNQADISGTDDNGNTVSNRSTNGTTPDPTLNDPTPLLLEDPVVSVSKDATIVSTTNGAAPFVVKFDIYIENQGDVDLSNLSATENLVATFNSTGNFSITAPIAPATTNPEITTDPTSGGVTLNTGFDGNADTELIATGSSLAAGELVVITLTVEVATAGDYSNSVVASGDSPDGTPTSDTSNPGTTPSDPPDGDDTPTPVLLSGLTIDKSVSTTSDSNGATVEPGDTITYTLVVTNTGTSDLTAITVNDVIPTPTVYVPNSATGGDTQTENGTPVTSIDWTINTLVSGTPVTLTFQVTVP